MRRLDIEILRMKGEFWMMDAIKWWNYGEIWSPGKGTNPFNSFMHYITIYAIESIMHTKTVAKNLRSKVMQSENKILSDNVNY